MLWVVPIVCSFASGNTHGTCVKCFAMSHALWHFKIMGTAPFSVHLTNVAASDFTNLIGSVEQGHTSIPAMEDMLAVHLLPPSAASRKSCLRQEQEVLTLLRKGAIKEVPFSEENSGFYSRFFLVPNKDGGLYLTFDLRPLNYSLFKSKFKMPIQKIILTQIQPGDLFVTVDLKDAIFTFRSFRKFLRFALGDNVWNCMDAALAPMRLQGIRTMNYTIQAVGSQSSGRDCIL